MKDIYVRFKTLIIVAAIVATIFFFLGIWVCHLFHDKAETETTTTETTTIKITPISPDTDTIKPEPIKILEPETSIIKQAEKEPKTVYVYHDEKIYQQYLKGELVLKQQEPTKEVKNKEVNDCCKEYYNQKFYNTNLVADSLLTFDIEAMVSENSLKWVKPKYTMNVYETTTSKEVTTVKTFKPKTLKLGLSANAPVSLDFTQFNINILVKGNQLYQVGYNTEYKLILGAGFFF